MKPYQLAYRQIKTIKNKKEKVINPQVVLNPWEIDSKYILQNGIVSESILEIKLWLES